MNESQSFSELINMISSLTERIAALEREVARLRGDTPEVPVVPFDDEPIDLSLDEVGVPTKEDAPVLEEAAHVAVGKPHEEVEPVPLVPEIDRESALEPVDDLPFGDAPKVEEVVEPAPEESVEEKIEAAIGSVNDLPVVDLPESEEDKVVFIDQPIQYEEVLPKEESVPEVEVESTPAWIVRPETENVRVPEMEDSADMAPAVPDDLPEAGPEAVLPLENVVFGDEPSFDLFGSESVAAAVVSEPRKGRGRPRKEVRILNDAEAAQVKTSVADALVSKAPWRVDRPGPEVKDIRSAIGLGDRVVFINTLFRKDAQLYQKTITDLNGFSSLDDAVRYITECFPEWKMQSDDVYKFMMAVRRKIR